MNLANLKCKSFQRYDGIVLFIQIKKHYLTTPYKESVKRKRLKYSKIRVSKFGKTTTFDEKISNFQQIITKE